MNISQIETDFDKAALYLKDLVPDTHQKVKQFYRSKITELLKSTRLEKKPIREWDSWNDDDRGINIERSEGYNQAVSDQDKKISEALQ